MGISRDQVGDQFQKYLAAQKQLPDPNNLKLQIQNLKEKVDELYLVWQTEQSEVSKAKFKALIHDISMLVPPYHHISKLKEMVPDISESEKTQLMYYN